MRRIRKIGMSRELAWSIATALSVHAAVLFGPCGSQTNVATAREPKPEDTYLEVTLAASAPAAGQVSAATGPPEQSSPPPPAEARSDPPPQEPPPSPSKPEAIVSPEPAPPLPPTPVAAPAATTEPVSQPAVIAPLPAPTNAAPVVGGVLSSGSATVTNTMNMDGQYHILTQPYYLKRGQPEYPAVARRKRQEGVVVLTVFINALGGLDKIEIRESSGFPLLDEAAIAAERKSRFRPAYVDNRAVPAKAEVPYRFKLE